MTYLSANQSLFTHPLFDTWYKENRRKPSADKTREKQPTSSKPHHKANAPQTDGETAANVSRDN